MKYRELDAVVLRDDLPEHGLKQGDLGAVVQVLDDATVTVEFVLPSGRTHALVDLSEDSLRPAPQEEMPTERPRR
jgi:hypothetical protein